MVLGGVVSFINKRKKNKEKKRDALLLAPKTQGGDIRETGWGRERGEGRKESFKMLEACYSSCFLHILLLILVSLSRTPILPCISSLSTQDSIICK